MICAEQNKKISFLTTYNPFSNRAIFSFIPVLACWYMAIHYHKVDFDRAVYEAMMNQ